MKWYFNIIFIISYIACFIDSFKTNFYGITSATFDNYASSIAIKTVQNTEIFQCLNLCTKDPDCLAIFYHSGEHICVMLNQTYENTNGLQSYPGMKYYRILPLTCSYIPISELTGSMNRQIVPVDTAGEFGPSTVWCDLDMVPGKAITVLHHDQETRTLVDNFESCGSYSINLTYDVGLDVVKKIVDISTECKQYIKWECLGTFMRKPQKYEPCTFWRNRFKEISFYFTGTGPTTKYCDCPEESACYNQTYSGCNCDLTPVAWRSDEGFITNKTDLPITGFAAGDTGVMGRFTVIFSNPATPYSRLRRRQMRVNYGRFVELFQGENRPKKAVALFARDMSKD